MIDALPLETSQAFFASIATKYSVGFKSNPHIFNLITTDFDAAYGVEVETESKATKPETHKKCLMPLSKQRGNAYDGSEDPLWLLTIEEFEGLPDGTVLESISGKQTIKTTPWSDDETRSGYMAYGFRESNLPEL